MKELLGSLHQECPALAGQGLSSINSSGSFLSLFIAEYPEALKGWRKDLLSVSLDINLISVKQTLQKFIMWLFIIIYDSYTLKLYDGSDHSHLCWNMGQRRGLSGRFL